MRPVVVLTLTLLAPVLAGPYPLVAAAPPPPVAASLQLSLRTRVQPFKSSPDWREVTIPKSLPAREAAIIVCDMWDDHWCKAAARRCGALARKMEPVLNAARARGVTVIHAPSECMAFYKDYPQRQRLADLPPADPPPPLPLPDPPLPIDDGDGGCDDPAPVRPFKAWSREHPALTIGPGDCISDNGPEIYRLLKARGIKLVLVCGVHTNFCVCNRSFGIKQLTRWGVPCVLIRDLTDAMYNPKKAPFVSHDQGTELVIAHIEKNWCPSVLSEDLLR